MEHLKDRVAVVTGAASGIGLAVAQALVTGGMRVVMADVDAERVAAEAAALQQPDSVLALMVDVRDSASVDAVARMAVEHFGGLHVAVNNAGILNSGLAWELSIDDWRSVLEVNLWGVIHGVRSFVPRILTTGEGGHVVNVASMAALLPMGTMGPYTVAKHGVLGLSEVLRADLEGIGAPVGVSVVFPGLVQTAMSPIGDPPPIAAANIVDAIRRRRTYVYTDHWFTDEVAARLGELTAARADVLP
jgi:NAD(P)-dependent dehydrogenase (short-subunit alcohol dehydrogenase family)